MVTERLKLPVVNHKKTVGFVRDRFLASIPSDERPASIIVQRGHAFHLLKVVDVLAECIHDPNTIVGDLELQDVVFKTSDSWIDSRLLDMVVGNTPWAEWCLRKHGRMLLLCEQGEGYATFIVREVWYLELKKSAPQCVCENRHGYLVHEVPDDRLCVYCRQQLHCMN